MRKAIEGVIDRFHERFQSALKRADYNAASDWEYAINELKEVLANEPLKFGERIRGTEHNLPTEKEGEI